MIHETVLTSGCRFRRVPRSRHLFLWPVALHSGATSCFDANFSAWKRLHPSRLFILKTPKSIDFEIFPEVLLCVLWKINRVAMSLQRAERLSADDFLKVLSENPYQDWKAGMAVD